MILTDHLIDRVHRFNKATLRLSGEAAVLLDPTSVGTELGTGYALFAGEGCPVTQIIGIAHREPGDIAEIEAFFAPKTPNWEVTVTPFTDPAAVRALLDAGYRPGQFEGTLAQIIETLPDEPTADIREIDGDAETWTEVTGRGWSGDETDAFTPDNMAQFAGAMRTRRYLAYIDGIPAASAAMVETDDAVGMMGATTRVPFRGRGLQTALLARRLRDAGAGRLAIMGAVPGSDSHRNAQRAGFNPLYSTLTLMRK